MKNSFVKRIVLYSFLALALVALNAKNIFAADSVADSTSTLFVPLLGLTSVPKPLALPDGTGNVTYNYAVKNFLKENPLSDIQVTDNTCSPTKYITGDDNGNSLLDSSETWRYTCTTKLTQTTKSVAIAIGHSNGITATHTANATVVVGAKDPAPLVSIINITKVANPLSLPAEGGKITFTYKVNNPGEIPLSDVSVSDDKCKTMSGKLGDTNGNNLLDMNEVWIYNCTTTLKQTTTNTVYVTASGNGLKATDSATITVNVDIPVSQASPSFPNAGDVPTVNSDLKIIAWEVMSGLLSVLILFYVYIKKNKPQKMQKSRKFFTGKSK